MESFNRNRSVLPFDNSYDVFMCQLCYEKQIKSMVLSHSLTNKKSEQFSIRKPTLAHEMLSRS